MTDIDPIDTSDELSAADTGSDPVDVAYDDSFDETFESDTYETASTYETDSYETGSVLQIDDTAPTTIDDAVTYADPAPAPSPDLPEIELVPDATGAVDPVGTGFDGQLIDAAPPAPGTGPPEFDPTGAPVTDSFDDGSTPEATAEWRSAYDDWQSAVTTTGHSPLMGGLDVDGTPIDAGVTPLDGTAADGSIAGEPFADTEFWFEQNTTFTCGPASATQIISDFTGHKQMDENELYTYANDKGWLVDSDLDGDIDGMSIDNLSQLLADHDVPNQVTSGDVDDLETYLSEGRSIVLFLDNEDLPGMQEQDGVENSLNDDPNHFVRLTGIDRARGIAYLSDPGRPDGQNLVVPIDMLEEAWNDSHNQMVVTDTADPTPDGQVTAEPPTETEPPTTETDSGTTETDTPGIDTAPRADGSDATADDVVVVPPAPAPAASPQPPAAHAPAAPPQHATAASAPQPPVGAPTAPPPVDFGIGESIDDMLETASHAAAVDLTTPESGQPDGLFDSALGFVLIPVAVSAGVAATLGYTKLRSNS